MNAYVVVLHSPRNVKKYHSSLLYFFLSAIAIQLCSRISLWPKYPKSSKVGWKLWTRYMTPSCKYGVLNSRRPRFEVVPPIAGIIKNGEKKKSRTLSCVTLSYWYHFFSAILNRKKIIKRKYSLDTKARHSLKGKNNYRELYETIFVFFPYSIFFFRSLKLQFYYISILFWFLVRNLFQLFNAELHNDMNH